MKHLTPFEQFISEEEEIEIDGLEDISDEEADDEDIDIDIEIEDEDGKSLDEAIKPDIKKILTRVSGAIGWKQDPKMRQELLDKIEVVIKEVMASHDYIIEDETNEKARPPKILPKQRKANSVKSKVVKELLGPESKLRPVINKIFLKVQKEIKKEAATQGVPVTKINLDKLTIKR